MSTTISESLKKKVAFRADFRCEYCRLSQKVSFYTFHIDHIKSVKHGGLTIFQNLAYCCPDCNFFKGSDLGTFVDSDDFWCASLIPEKTRGKIISTFKTVAFMAKQILVLLQNVFLSLMNPIDLFLEGN